MGSITSIPILTAPYANTLVYRNDYGWKVPSLPARVIRELGYNEPAVQRVLLNWRGKPFSYQTVTFSDVFDDMMSKEQNTSTE